MPRAPPHRVSTRHASSSSVTCLAELALFGARGVPFSVKGDLANVHTR